MKKIIVYLMTALMLCASLPSMSRTTDSKTAAATPINSATPSPEAKVLLSRLDEINKIDKDQLSASQKKNLRKEVRTIKQQLKDIGGGVYISVGALILILILLIILV
jgi:hypothetical protein